MYISIVFPNWNRASATMRYLASVHRSNIAKNKLEIIMVDNNSTDNSINVVKKNYPSVKIIKLNKNYGPSYARNQGIKRAQGEIIFCTDNDLILEPNTLNILSKELHKNSNTGIVGAKVVSIEDKQTIVTCGYEFNRWLAVENGLKNCHFRKEADWIAGCCMMFRKTLIDEIGLFDEAFTFFGEDADFGLRARKAGYGVVSLPNAIVYHPTAKKKQLNPSRYANYYASKFRLIRKHTSSVQQLVSIGMHLTVLSLIRYLIGKPEYWRLKWQALKKVIKNN